MQTLPIEKITTDTELQPRAGLDTQTATDYCEAIRNGAKFPPLILFYDGETYYLADGFHRHYAYTLLGAKQVPVEIRNGSRRDALLYSCGANAEHGLRRSNEDKRRAVEKLLADAAWARWSSRRIAEACGVSHTYVDKLRNDRSGNDATSMDPRLAQRGDQTYEHARRRRQAGPAQSEESEKLHLQQENLGRALEIISGIAMHVEPQDFPVTERMQKHLRLARTWLNALAG